MKIYTRTGDAGETALFGGGRVSKAHPRVAAYGTVDELNAFLGQAVGAMEPSPQQAFVTLVQHDLFTIGSALCTPPPEGARRKPVIPDLPAGRVAEMEAWIDRASEAAEPLRNFILPGGSAGAAALHVARTVCRRAERMVIDLRASESVDAGIIVYLNRLSDLLFALARLENHEQGVPDVIWRKDESGDPDRPGGAPPADRGMSREMPRREDG